MENCKFLSVIFFSIIFQLSNFNCLAQNVGINTTGAAPDPSAILDINAAPENNKGLLLPRLNTAQRNSILNPAQSLLIYNTTDSCFQIFIGIQWKSFGCGGANPPSTFACGTSTVTFNYKGSSVTYGTVESNTIPKRCWLDRNIGANQVATSITDSQAYGDLFQWGRLDDGHQTRTSNTTTIISTTDVPGHGDFILNTNSNWRNPANNGLWQGYSGINNPCPTGFRTPTEDELNEERLTWVSNNGLGAFASPLKLTASGIRNNNGIIFLENENGVYWSSTINTVFENQAQSLSLLNTLDPFASTSGGTKGSGRSVRCIMD